MSYFLYFLLSNRTKLATFVRLNKLEVMIQVNDKKFELSLANETIQSRELELAKRMEADLKGKNPLFICVLNGAFMFASDLVQKINNTDIEICFVKLASYEGVLSTGKVKEIIGLDRSVKDRHIVVIEDIVDTGATMYNIIENLTEQGAKKVDVATLFFKPQSIKRDLELKYVGFEIPNDFIVGYGLDYDGLGRNLRDIHTLVK